jgi:hypothetical protein
MQLTDRPRPSFQRRPAKGAVFQKTGMPFTATPREGISARRDCSLRPSRRLSRSRRPHFVPSGDGAFDWALRGHGAVTRVVRDRLESTDTFFTRWNFRAWD